MLYLYLRIITYMHTYMVLYTLK